MKNNKVVPIIKNEVERSIKNKWFVILNLLMLIVTVVGLNYKNVIAVFKHNNISLSNEMVMYIQDNDNIAYNRISNAFKDKENLTIEKKDSIEEYKNEELSSNTILVVVQKDAKNYVSAQIISKETILATYIDTIEETLTSIKDTMILDNKNLTKDEIELIKSKANVERVILSESVDTNETTSIIQVASNYIIFFILLLCLSKIANTISQEKMSKSIEYILTSISTKEYMISKVLSMCLIVVIQFVFTICYVLIAIMISSLFTTIGTNIEGTSAIDISSVISLKTIGYLCLTFIFMCLTTFIQGVIQSVMSAKTTNIQEAGNATIFLVMLNLVLYSVVTLVVTPLKSASAISYIVSVLPIASMYFIPTMVIIGQANVFQVILSLVILIATIPLSLIVAQKPFKNAILDYSNKKNKKIEGIEKIISTREYQERMIDRKESSKKGFVVGISVILLIILQVIGGLLVSLAPSIANKITFISQDNLSLIFMCIIFIISIYVPYLILKSYIPKEDSSAKDDTSSSKKESIIKCIKYIILSIPIMSVIQVFCSFAIEKIGVNSDIMNSMGMFNYSGKLATVLMFIEIAILPAIFEELFIRKGVYGVLKDKGAIFATIVSALIFAVIHMNITQFVFAFCIGILFAIVREKTGKLYPTMILHFINNGFATIEVLFYDHITFMQIFTYFKIALNSVGFCILIYMLYRKVMELKDKEAIQKLKEELDYRKIKLNITENMFVFKDYTFFTAIILAIVMFVTIERVI